MDRVREIAQAKMVDLNANDVMLHQIVAGATFMGITVQDDPLISVVGRAARH